MFSRGALGQKEWASLGHAALCAEPRGAAVLPSRHRSHPQHGCGFFCCSSQTSNSFQKILTVCNAKRVKICISQLYRIKALVTIFQSVVHIYFHLSFSFIADYRERKKLLVLFTLEIISIDIHFIPQYKEGSV